MKEIVICGYHAVREALKRGSENFVIRKIFISQVRRVEYQSLIQESTRKKIKWEICRVKKIDRFCREGKSQGICAISGVKYLSIKNLMSDVEGEKNLMKGRYQIIGVIDRIQSRYNLGSILRTCMAVGVNQVIISKDNSVDAAVVQGASGMVHGISIYRIANLKDVLVRLRDKGFLILSCSERLHPRSRVLWQVPVKDRKKMALIFGNEEKGVKDNLIDLSDYLVKVPMRENVDSLNVAVAAGIILYNIAEQQRWF